MVDTVRSLNKAKTMNISGSGTSKLTFQPYITVWQSVLEFICGLALSSGHTEVGGELYGLFSHVGRPVIMLATPPGPNAIHNKAHFRQDIDFFKENNRFILDNYSLQYCGNWHSHHDLDIKSLSKTDIKSINSIAFRNGFSRAGQIVLTFEDNATPELRLTSKKTGDKSPLPARPSKINSKAGLKQISKASYSKIHSGLFRRSPVFIRVHSFFYFDARSRNPIRCPIRVMDGVSPITMAFNRNCDTLGSTQAERFPISRILFDEVESSNNANDYIHKLPNTLRNNYITLPENVRKSGSMCFKQGIVLFSLKIPDERGKVFVVYRDESPYRVMAVYYTGSQTTDIPIDITKMALCFGPLTELRTIYERTVRFAVRKDPQNSKIIKKR